MGELLTTLAHSHFKVRLTSPFFLSLLHSGQLPLSQLLFLLSTSLWLSMSEDHAHSPSNISPPLVSIQEFFFSHMHLKRNEKRVQSSENIQLRLTKLQLIGSIASHS
jgi:hypothetical protein